MSNVEGGPVTVIVSRRVKPSQTGAFEEWLRGVLGAASRFEGHLGANVLRPTNPAAEDYVVIFRFDTFEHLSRWEESEIRAEWLSRVDAYTEGPAKVQKVTGLEYWFALPGSAGVRPPPRHKMLVVTVIALYPMITLLMPLLAEVTAPLPGLLRPLVSSTIMVSLMTYLVMPALIRLFSFWLFSARQT
jgi:uncharacterized protein